MAISVLSVDGIMRLALQARDTVSGALLAREFGRNSVPELSIDLDEYGTGNNQINKLYYAKRTLATVTTDSLDLAGGLSDFQGSTITFTKIKLCAVAIASPNGTKKLYIGPQGVANSMTANWGGTGATVYREFMYFDIAIYDPINGYTVTAGTGDLLNIYNPTGSSIDYHIVIAGV